MKRQCYIQRVRRSERRDPLRHPDQFTHVNKGKKYPYNSVKRGWPGNYLLEKGTQRWAGFHTPEGVMVTGSDGKLVLDPTKRSRYARAENPQAGPQAV